MSDKDVEGAGIKTWTHEIYSADNRRALCATSDFLLLQESHAYCICAGFQSKGSRNESG
jgi:hypothetical protein